MPKRKSGSGVVASTSSAPSLSSLDAALDLLVCDTFGRLESLTTKFEAAAGVKLNDGVIMRRWEEAAKRYWVMKSIDDLSCSSSIASKTQDASREPEGDEMAMNEEDAGGSVHANGYERPLPAAHHPGVSATFELDADDELQWRRWTPRVNDPVLVQLQDGVIWPGKIIEKRVFLQGRSSIPRGYHFHAVRIYCDTIEPTLTIKSRLIPFSLRPSPPLLASSELQGAYHHAANPTSFDMLAGNRESAAAHVRTHPGVGENKNSTTIKAEKEEWKKFVNWLMNERRVEKLRALVEEREKRLKAVTQLPSTENGWEEDAFHDNGPSRKRRAAVAMSPLGKPGPSKSSTTVHKVETDTTERGGIFRITSLNSSPSSINIPSPVSSRAGTPLSSYIRPPLSAPHRSGSPRRSERRRASLFQALGEFSPRSRGTTYTPPRVLPSGDETAPFTLSPAPTLKSFDFCSPLGPSRYTKGTTNSADDDVVMAAKNGSTGTSLEAVREEEGEDASWTVVVPKSRSKRAGSEPYEKVKDAVPRRAAGLASDDLEL